jgi:hypothetical protein
MYLVYSWVSLISGIIILLGAAITVHAVKVGSRSRFAYKLLMYSFVLGFVYIGYFFVYQFPLTLTNLTKDPTVQRQSFRIYFTLVIVQFLMTVQDWIFSNRFLVASMIAEGRYNRNKIKITTIFYIVLITYLAAMISLWGIMMVTFPGYVNDHTDKAYHDWIMTYVHIFDAIYTFFVAFNTVSITVMIISILKLNKVIKRMVYLQSSQIEQNGLAVKLYIAGITSRVITVYVRAWIFWQDLESLYIPIDIVLALSDVVY